MVNSTIEKLPSILYGIFIMLTGIFLALGASFSHSLSFIFRKRGLETVDYKVFISLRILLGAVIAGILLWSIGSGLSGLTIHGAFPFIIVGIVGSVFGLIATTMAIHEIGASRTHALNSISPLVTALLEVILLDLVITPQFGLGILVIVVGASFLSFRVYEGDSSNSDRETKRPLFGLFLALYGALAMGILAVLQKLGLEYGATPLQGLLVQFSTASIVYGGYLVIRRPKLERVSKAGYFLVAVIFLTGLVILSLYAMTILSATLVNALLKTAPLFTVILTQLYLKGIEEVNWQTGLNALLIVIGAILVSTA